MAEALTSDGHKAYLEAVEDAFGGDTDYAMLVKLYGSTGEGGAGTAPRKCSPASASASGRTVSPATPIPTTSARATPSAKTDHAHGRAALYPSDHGFSKKLSNHEASRAVQF